MATKEQRTGAELTTMIMQEVQKHKDCIDITGVAIIRFAQQAPHDPNWSFAWTRNYTTNLRPVIADEIARKLQTQFDIV
jgi:hypothetical protein